MKSLTSDFLLLVWMAISLFLPGLFLVRRFTRLRGSDALAFGAVAGILLQAALGICLAVGREAREPVIVASILATLAAIFYLWRSRSLTALCTEISRPVRAALVVWLVFVFGCVATLQLRPALPRNLPDGKYVFKSDTLNVRLQYMTNLPADNFLPYAVTEFFLRRISFRKEHPLLPGNEISNRTILMSLVALPYRAAFGMPPRQSAKLGTLQFAGGHWPNVAEIYRDDYYRQFEVVGVFLNSLLFLGLICAFGDCSWAAVVLPAGALLYLTDPYLITQTIFVWPKALAGFFLVLSWHAARRHFHPALVALCAGLAYQSHPFALVFVVALGIFFIVRLGRGEIRLRALLGFVVTLLLFLVPWFIWTRWRLQLPSDMIWQNLAGPGTGPALAHPIDFIWVRARNFCELFTPTMFFVYPFAANGVVEAARNCLPGAVGIFLIVPAILEAAILARRCPLLAVAIATPFALVTAIFSYPAPTILHGYQAAVGMLIFLGTLGLRGRVPPFAFWTIAGLQLATNLSLLALRAEATGLHFP